MKAKRKRKSTVRKPQPRNTRPKRIANMAQQNTGEALGLALYGEHANAVHQLELRSLSGKTDADLIQGWLSVADFEADPSLKGDAAVAWKRQEMEKRFAVYFAPTFCDRIGAGDYAFFHDFADTIKREVAIRNAAMLENVDRDSFELKLLAEQFACAPHPANINKLAKKIVDQSMAVAGKPNPKDREAIERFNRTREKQLANTRRSLRRINKRLRGDT